MGSIEGGTAVYVSASDVGVRHLSADGTVVAWSQLHSFDASTGLHEREEHWTAQFQGSTTDVSQRRLSETTPRVGGALGGGVFALEVPGPAGERWIELHDVQTGMTRVYRPPSAIVLRSVIYVSAAELAVTATLQDQQTLLRIDLSALPVEG
ncbi:MAG: hypothetical protein OXT09_11440 [Myxococcales bacterium]|nr:hypothetical protein [Myxococcales bacterium]